MGHGILHVIKIIQNHKPIELHLIAPVRGLTVSPKNELPVQKIGLPQYIGAHWSHEDCHYPFVTEVQKTTAAAIAEVLGFYGSTGGRIGALVDGSFIINYCCDCHAILKGQVVYSV